MEKGIKEIPEPIKLYLKIIKISTKIILSFVSRFIFLFSLISQVYREKERQRKIFCPMIHSPNGRNSQSCTDQKQDAKSQ